MASTSNRDEEKEALKDPAKLFEYRIKLERTSNSIFKTLVFNETCQDVKKAFRANIEKLMRERLHNDEVMMSKLIPSYQPWCRRLTPGDAYLEAFQADNAALIDDPITEITKTGVVTKSASEHQYIDVLALAAGFRNNRVPPWNMRGKDGTLLSDLWARNPDGYLSVTVHRCQTIFPLDAGRASPLQMDPYFLHLASCLSMFSNGH
jgi:cation diffusion facilitator CzcD-associated flavoprotein CzcO